MDGRIKRLPKWCLTGQRPAIYDVESSTAIGQTARLYAFIDEFIVDYNKFVDEINVEIEKFESSLTLDFTCFKNNITKICNDYIDTMDMKIECQDRKIQDAIDYMKTNLSDSVQSVIIEMRDAGELNDFIQNALLELDEKFSVFETEINSLLENTKTELLEKINQNTTNISTNSSDIEDLKTTTETNSTNIETNTSNIATNTSDIEDLKTTTETNSTNIATNTSDISSINTNLNKFYYQSLYKSTDGSNGEITLSGGWVSTYDFIEIFYRTDDGFYGSVRVYTPQGKTVNLIGTNIQADTSIGFVKNANVYIDSSKITVTNYGVMKVSSSSVEIKTDTNYIYITNVHGYRK